MSWLRASTSHRSVLSRRAPPTVRAIWLTSRRVSEAISEVIAVTGFKDLSLLLEAPEGLRVDDPIAVTLILRAVGVRGSGYSPTFGVLVSVVA